MSCISATYNEQPGVYVSVRPVSSIVVPEVVVPEWLTFKPVPVEDLHITLAYNVDAKPSRVEVAQWLATNCVEEFTSWRAAALPTVQSWFNQERLYIGLEFYSPELFSLHESIKASLKVDSSYPDYKCHMTFGSYRGIPEAVAKDPAFVTNFLRAYVGPANNNVVELALLRFANAE